jgi:hypothetical protein
VRAYVSCRGYVCISLSVRFFAVNQGGTADYIKFVLGKAFLLCQGFFYCQKGDVPNESAAKHLSEIQSTCYLPMVL